MSENKYVRSCPCCSVELNITLDTMTDDVSITSPELSPLVKDKQKIVDAYRRIKKLPLSWEKAHRARGLIYAGEIIAAISPRPQAVDYVISAMEWLSTHPQEWNLGDVAARITAYNIYRRTLDEVKKRPRCGRCGEQFEGVGDRCPRHEGI